MLEIRGQRTVSELHRIFQVLVLVVESEILYTRHEI